MLLHTEIAYGAYGRKANIADFKAGKDFRIYDTYFSIRDADALMREDVFNVTFYDGSKRVFSWVVGTDKFTEY